MSNYHCKCGDKRCNGCEVKVMKATIFFKDANGQYLSWQTLGVIPPPPYHHSAAAAFVEQDITVRPESLLRNGFHLASRIDPPKPLEPVPVSPMLPRTLREIRNHPLSLDTESYERAVGRLLASGNAKSGQCQSLLKRLVELDLAFGRLRRELLQIPDVQLPPTDELVAERT